MAKRNSTSFRRATTSTPNPAIPPQPQDDQEELWQWLMTFNYVVHETVDAMNRERSSGNPSQPLNQSWQQFVHHLWLQKPRVTPCLDRLLQAGFLDQPSHGQRGL